MHTPRFYLPKPLSIETEVVLNERISYHLCVVLRSKLKDSCILFNGDGFEYTCHIKKCHKKSALLTIEHQNLCTNESSLRIHLAQGISANKRMDYSVQKATECGVYSIIPIQCQLSQIRRRLDQPEKKRQHWQKIAISAAEQSMRGLVPTIESMLTFDAFIKTQTNVAKFILEPGVSACLSAQKPPKGDIIFAVGAEGGFSQTEIDLAQKAGFVPVAIGPRILRTETVAPVILSLAQSLWGDI